MNGLHAHGTATRTNLEVAAVDTRRLARAAARRRASELEEVTACVLVTRDAVGAAELVTLAAHSSDPVRRHDGGGDDDDEARAHLRVRWQL